MNDQQLAACIKLVQNRCDGGYMDNRPFLLNGNKMLTIKRKDNTYAKGTIGEGTKMRLTAAYIGKRGTPIFVFKPGIFFVSDAASAKIQFVEMGLEEARKHLEGFQDFWVEVTGDKSIIGLTDEAILEAAQRERISTYPNEDFGTW